MSANPFPSRKNPALDRLMSSDLVREPCPPRAGLDLRASRADLRERLVPIAAVNRVEFRPLRRVRSSPCPFVRGIDVRASLRKLAGKRSNRRAPRLYVRRHWRA